MSYLYFSPELNYIYAMEKETYLTIRNNCEKEIEKIKGSRFTGRLFRVKSKEEAELELEKVRKKYFDATHNCFAYTAGEKENAVSRFSDDGEPSGTAGRPMMSALEASGLSKVLLVVTRYYGGTNLGTGGLARAYAEAAKEVIEAAEIEVVEIKSELKLSYRYEMTGTVMNLIGRYEASVMSEEFDEGAKLKIRINKGFVPHFTDEIFDKSNGEIKAELCC
jgi:uncharacterized YigZ family protein